MSTYKFDNNNNKYYLVYVSLYSIHKIELSKLDNINQQLRAININKSIETTNHIDYPTQDVMLFEHNVNNSIIKLLFSGKVELINYDYNENVQIKMHQPSKVLNNFRNSKYIDDSSFMNEQFYNYETVESENEKCILFLTKSRVKTGILIDHSLIPLKNSDKLLFNRYHNTIIKEQPELTINNLCQSNKTEDYITLMKHYNIDINKYNKTNFLTFRELFLRQINPKFRPLVSQYYFNNLINAPSDGRVTSFNINKDSKLKIMDQDYLLNEIIGVSFSLNSGSGMLTRLTPGDYQRVSMPYFGYLTEIISTNNYVSLKFENTYFMPPSVSEREYISVLYGHNVNMSRNFPELVDVQPKIKLIFYLVLIGNDIALSNNKLLKIQVKNTRIKIPYENMWFEKGEEVGGFNCCNGHVLFITNRQIDFTNDIRYHSMDKHIECYIKNKDIFGLLL